MTYYSRLQPYKPAEDIFKFDVKSLQKTALTFNLIRNEKFTYCVDICIFFLSLDYKTNTAFFIANLILNLKKKEKKRFYDNLLFFKCLSSH